VSIIAPDLDTSFALVGDGVVLRGERQGPADAPLVILLHGGGQSRSAWRSAAGALAKAGLRTVSIDLRGHGHSDWSPDGDYAFGRHIADLVAVIEQLGSEAVLIGASLGGHVSLLTAVARPDLVRGIVLADVTPFVDESIADDLRASLRAGTHGFATLDEAAATLARFGEQPPRKPSARLREHLRDGPDGRLYWKWDPRIVEDRFVRHGGEGGLFATAAERLSVPTLVLRAEYSKITSPAQLSRFREVSPHIQVREIAGIGHMLTGDSNRAYTPAILEFLRSLLHESSP
jgi:non-heme chloroperoxidase